MKQLKYRKAILNSEIYKFMTMKIRSWLEYVFQTIENEAKIKPNTYEYIILKLNK